MRCVRTRSVFQHSDWSGTRRNPCVCVVFTMFYVRLSRFLMKYVERISSRTIRIHYEMHFESQGKDFARERMFWYREIFHKHDLSSSHAPFTHTLSLFLLSTVFSIYSLIYNSARRLSSLLFSFFSLSRIHIHTAVNTRAFSSIRLFSLSYSRKIT